MTDMRADVDALRARSAQLFDIADEISDQVTTARSAVTELASTGWTGGAATAFSATFDEWDAAAQDSAEALRRLAGGVRASASDVMNLEQQHDDDIRSLGAMLDVASMMGGR